MTFLRSALFNAYFYCLTAAMAFRGLFLSRTDWPVVAAYARRWAKYSLAGLRVCRIDWRVEGLEHLPPTGPALIASMHQSAFDTLIWADLMPSFCYVFKLELARVPMFGNMLLSSGMIPVDREAGVNAMRSLLRATDKAVADKRQIVIFPEGTRVAPGEHVRLLPGVAAIAVRSRLPVFPVVTDSGLYWGRKSFLKLPGTITVRILPPIPAGQSREAVLSALESAFHAGLAGGSPGPAGDAPRPVRDPVENSVGELPSRLPTH